MVERIPPHDAEAEQAVIACCLVNADCVAIAAELEVASFYKSAHRAIFAAIMRLFRKGSEVDLITVRAELGDDLDAAGGYGYLVDLSASIPTTAMLSRYVEIVADHAERRAAIAALSDGLDALYDPASSDPVTATMGRLLSVASSRGEERCRPFGDVAEERYSEIAAAVQDPRGDGAPDGAFAFGLYDLDRLVRVEPGDLVVIGARPSAGKTALGLQVLIEVATGGQSVLFHSLEMSSRAIATRYYTLKTAVSARRQHAGYVARGEMEAAATACYEVGAARIWIDDRGGLTSAQIAASAQRLIAKTGQPLGLLVIDHLTKIVGADPRASRHHQITQITGELKDLAKRTGTPILLLAQLGRAVEREGNREPRASDLRESGSVEEDADVILLLHRPDREGRVSEAKLIVAKNRNGETGAVTLEFEAARTRFACKEYADALA